ncbi:TetR family transcriptional regulator [Microbacterium sp. CSI-V]|uniref:TetR/AcrR family transcriptional regulator n=1 Tax=unclassified Microbacterium TaxID=2609290 RepID=UPI00097BBF6F|nr:MULTISPECIES: TetR/AcrR family transcriptional regulator [unclassified Microbacterium]MXS75204.1 TetR/AcrR family transcriptional regulator [Microbacterium sp. TL13]ONI66433.1 TetR family transcriptional regulator [Microbacterium sp. CSI-V]
MGRMPTFDRRAVVDAARDVFWQRGYAEAGITELEEATGLTRSSLYNAFGSKRGLFDAVLAQYLDDIVRTRLRPLGGGDPSALEAYVEDMRAAIAADSPRARLGCLLLNAGSSPLASDDADVRSLVSGYAAEMRAAIRAAVADRRPDLVPDAVDSLSAVCASLVVAALTLARADRDAAVATLASVPATLESWG